MFVRSLMLGPYGVIGSLAGIAGLTAYAEPDEGYRIPLPFMHEEGAAVPIYKDARVWILGAAIAADRVPMIGDAMGGAVGNIAQVAAVSAAGSLVATEGLRWYEGGDFFDLLPAPSDD